MKQESRGILTLFLVTGIAMAMLSAFGVHAIHTSASSKVSSAQCQYSHMILSAKEHPAQPAIF